MGSINACVKSLLFKVTETVGVKVKIWFYSILKAINDNVSAYKEAIKIVNVLSIRKKILINSLVNVLKAILIFVKNAQVQ